MKIHEQWRKLGVMLCLITSILYAVDCACVGKQPGACCSGSGTCEWFKYAVAPDMCGKASSGGTSCSPLKDEYGNTIPMTAVWLRYVGGNCVVSSCSTSTTNNGVVCVVSAFVEGNTNKCNGGNPDGFGNYYDTNYWRLTTIGTCPPP